MEQIFLRLPAVMQMTGMHKTWIYINANAGLFPKPVKIGARAVAWLSGDIQNWIAARAAASKGEAK